MIITCPNCAARFNVADQALGAAGKTVRCAKCGHKWHQMPDGQTMEAAAPAARPATRPAPAPRAAAPAAAPRPAKPAPKPARPRPAPPVGDIPMEMAPAGSAPVASVPAGPAMDEDFPMPPEVAGAGNAFRSTGNMVTDSAPPPDQFLATAEPEPIPEGFASPPTPAKKRSNVLLYTLLVILALLVGIPAGLYFLRYKVVELLPMTAEYYQLFDLDTENLGAGLKFRNIVSERVIENNVEMLVVRGQIANITDKAKEVPLLRLALYDANNLVLQDKVVPPPDKQLASNETTGFRVQLESPSANARRFEITFAPKPN